MPYRRRGFSGRNRGIIINSTKNVKDDSFGTSGTASARTIAIAKISPDNLNTNEVSIGCKIKAIYVVINGCGLGGTGVLNDMGIYLFKNPGNNLTPPGVFVTGSSNEKKFIIRQWKFMIMRNQDGNLPFHWEGWLKVPRGYQRMGTDDVWQLVFANTATLTGHASYMVIYKWYQ